MKSRRDFLSLLGVASVAAVFAAKGIMNSGDNDANFIQIECTDWPIPIVRIRSTGNMGFNAIYPSAILHVSDSDVNFE